VVRIWVRLYVRLYVRLWVRLQVRSEVPRDVACLVGFRCVRAGFCSGVLCDIPTRAGAV
jgi:hypothetical protein